MVDGQRLELRCERYVPTFSLPAAKDGITRWEGRRAEKGRGSSREGEGSQPGFARAHSWVTEGRGEESRAEQSNLGGASEVGGVGGGGEGKLPPSSHLSQSYGGRGLFPLWRSWKPEASLHR